MALQDAINPMQGVSGPGQYSKRTDLEYQSPEYGAGVQYAQDKAGAPLARTTGPKGATNTEVRQAAQAAAPMMGEVTPLFAPSQRPGEVVTHGVDVGPGAGSNVLSMNKSNQKLSDALVKMLPFDTTGEIAVLYQDALARGN